MNHLEYLWVSPLDLDPLNGHKELEYGSDWVYGPVQYAPSWNGWKTFLETWEMLGCNQDAPAESLPVTDGIERAWHER